MEKGAKSKRPTGFPNRQLRDSWAAGSGRPAMLTKMTDADWITVLKVFKASRSRRGDKGRDDKQFLSALHYFAVHNITWRALPAEFGNWNSVWKRFWRLSQAGVFEAFFEALASMSETAHLVQMFDSTVVRAHVSAAGAKGGSTARRSVARAVDFRPRFT
jgi:transposase